MLAKSSGVSLIEHSKLVYEISKILCELNDVSDQLILDSLKYASLLHDIGKCETSFQKYLKTGKGKLKYQHQELSWVYLYYNFNIGNDIIKNYVLDAVYWHHGLNMDEKLDDSKKRLSNILYDYITDKDKKSMYEYLLSCVSENLLVNNTKETLPPSYYNIETYDDTIQDDKTYIRTCLVVSDRLASEYEELIKKPILKDWILSKLELTTHSYDTSNVNLERFNEQKNIIESINSNTAIINAPAGFGKTMLGVIWAIKNKKRVIWVCPRNFVASSVYESVKDLLKTLSLNYKVELYLSGEVQQSTHDSKGFDSDFIITNIDNYLKPNLDNSTMSRMYLTYNCSVIFDEYHELISQTPIFYSFINMMRIRHRYTNTNTLLLSATPIDIRYMYENAINKSCVLPDANKHYNAVHNKPYVFKIVEDFKLIPTNTCSIAFYNAISNAQQHRRSNDSILIHSEYEKNDKDLLFKDILKNYGKTASSSIKKKNITTTHVLQASLDISLKDAYESVMSPLQTLQRLGRCNRFGTYNNSNYYISKFVCQRENKVRELLYNTELTNLWFEKIKQYDNKSLTLDDVYVIYNDFNVEYKTKIRNWISVCMMESIKLINNIYPVKVKSNKNIDVITAGTNKLRNKGKEMFYICKYNNSTKYSEPFTKSLYNSDISDAFDEPNTVDKYIKEALRELEADDRYNYKITKWNGNIKDALLKVSKKSDTPYIRFDVVYDNIYGIVKKNFFN